MDAGLPPAEAHPTMVRADGSGSAASRRSSWWTLPSDILHESVRRIRIMAWLYALAFFLAGLLPNMIMAKAREVIYGVPSRWVPMVLSVLGGVAVALLVGSPRLSPKTKLYLGLGFEVLASLGIAFTEYREIGSPILFTKEMLSGGLGLSWVAPWVMLFSVVVPTRPGTAVLAAAGSVAMVPIVYGTGMATGSNVSMPPEQFFFVLVFPYFVILLMCYVGSRVVYRLGAAVREARELGSYRLRERLGAGGMGEVWRAEHRLLARPAAIKLIRPEILGPGDADGRQVLLQRFEREAQATALMCSAHTVELYDFGVTEEGTFYYVMELLDGLDLSQLVKLSGPVPPERAVYLLRQICDSLGEAHASGLIHRDVKPANVYVCRHGRKLDFVKVLDFGLVKRGAERDGNAEHATLDNLAGGTPAFMSPEQALGDKNLDGRSDLYAVGCVAYWLLTGTAVFTGQTPMETIVMHVNQDPEPPSRRSAQPIPTGLETIILDCLAKRPDARPQTADELMARLEAVPLAETWTPARAQQWWDRYRPPRETHGPAEVRRPGMA